MLVIVHMTAITAHRKVFRQMSVGAIKDELVDALGHDVRPDVHARGDLLTESLAVLLTLSIGHLLRQIGNVLHLLGMVRCHWLTAHQQGSKSHQGQKGGSSELKLSHNDN